MEIGTVVQLKSGGPEMTVEGFEWNPVNGDYDINKVICTWFDGNKKKQDTFQRVALEIIE